MESYLKHVERIENDLAAYAKRSFEACSPLLVDGGEAALHYEKMWAKDHTALKLMNRTPLQIERDRILYSNGMRKQTEKYHVLYNGPKRIVRNYTTHTMRMAQVTRSICRALHLNSDFAEAIAIGSKVGAVSFVHAAKGAIAEWVKNKVLDIDRRLVGHSNRPLPRLKEDQLAFEFHLEGPMPTWIQELGSTVVREKVKRYIPWAAGEQVEQMYSSGQESYWLLTTNPFINESRPGAYMPETMYGIWRHTRGLPHRKNAFHHRCEIGTRLHEIKWTHATYEAIVVQFADDITWVIENLNDANSAARLNNGSSMYQRVVEHLVERFGDDLPAQFWHGINTEDSGNIYTFFISDFATTSRARLDQLKDGADTRVALRIGASDAEIGLSEIAGKILDEMISFLNSEVFSEPRVRNRRTMLETVAIACLDLLYNDTPVMESIIAERATLERWTGRIEDARSLLGDDIHRIQLAVDILAEMGDQEIYDFVGIQSL